MVFVQKQSSDSLEMHTLVAQIGSKFLYVRLKTSGCTDFEYSNNGAKITIKFIRENTAQLAFILKGDRLVLLNLYFDGLCIDNHDIEISNSNPDYIRPLIRPMNELFNHWKYNCIVPDPEDHFLKATYVDLVMFDEIIKQLDKELKSGRGKIIDGQAIIFNLKNLFVLFAEGLEKNNIWDLSILAKGETSDMDEIFALEVYKDETGFKWGHPQTHLAKTCQTLNATKAYIQTVLQHGKIL
jgi:hypothetical protein